MTYNADNCGKVDGLLKYTAEIVASHVSNNTVEVSELPTLIETVYEKLSVLEGLAGDKDAGTRPAVPISQSVTDSHIVCLEDGRSFKMLKKHLKVQYDMTPEEYRAKWHLPPDYPMVAPNYSAKRRRLARESGLGKKAN